MSADQDVGESSPYGRLRAIVRFAFVDRLHETR